MCGDPGGLLTSAASGEQPDAFLPGTSPGVSDRKEGRLVNSSQPSAPENRLNGDPERERPTSRLPTQWKLVLNTYRP